MSEHIPEYEPVCLNCDDVGCDYCENFEHSDFEDDGQPDEQQEWDDLYGYGPEYDSYDSYDEY